MNVLCPSCQKMLTVPDQYAGQTMKCPLCSHAFAAPALPSSSPPPAATNPSPAGPTPHPGLPPLEPPTAPAVTQPPASKEGTYSFASPPSPTPPYPPLRGDEFARSKPGREAAPAEPSLPPPAPPGGYVHTRTIWISPRVVPWIAPAALALTFLLLFFEWVKKVGPEEDAQSGWGAALGRHYTALGFFFLLFFLAALLLSLACVIVPRLNIALPNWARSLWPWRSAIVAGVALLAFFFLLLQLLAWFDLEQANAKEGYYLVHRTLWLELAVLSLIVGVIGAALEFWLVLRKSRPLPRIDISW